MVHLTPSKETHPEFESSSEEEILSCLTAGLELSVRQTLATSHLRMPLCSRCALPSCQVPELDRLVGGGREKVRADAGLDTAHHCKRVDLCKTTTSVKTGAETSVSAAVFDTADHCQPVRPQETSMECQTDLIGIPDRNNQSIPCLAAARN